MVNKEWRPWKLNPGLFWGNMALCVMLLTLALGLWSGAIHDISRSCY